MPETFVNQVDCSKAEEFVQALSPLGDYFRDAGITEQWLFRGQGSDYKLVPSLFRPFGRFVELRGVGQYEKTLLAEQDLLVRFFELADKRGLVLPDDSQSLRSALQTLKSLKGYRNVAQRFWVVRGLGTR